MDDIEILKAARARIAAQRHFVMGCKAWNRKGREVSPKDATAVRWNALGAILAEGGSDRQYGHVQTVAREIAVEIDQRNLLGQDTADNIGHARTLRAFDQAIAALEADSAAA